MQSLGPFSQIVKRFLCRTYTPAGLVFNTVYHIAHIGAICDQCVTQMYRFVTSMGLCPNM